MIGRTLGHYRIVEQIGAGGMGVVYRARDERLERDVAIKVVRAGAVGDAEATKRFRKEALALSRFNHPRIASVYHFDSENGTDFIVMEYVPGVTLSQRLAEGPLSEPEVISLGIQLAEALEVAHAEGLVHRDLKPGNVMITSGGQAKILDFGLAQLLQPRSDEATTEALSEALAPAGTLPYMAPEQLKGGRVDPRTDVYAAGAVLYEMAAGQRIFPGRKQLVLSLAILNERPVSPRAVNPALSSGLEGVILKALSKDPDRRHGSALELKRELEGLVAQKPGAAPVVWRRRGVLALAWGLALLAVVLGLAAWGLRDKILGPTRPGRVESLAVLPLENLTGDRSQEYFADGMTEALIAELAKIRALRVISRTSAMRYKGTQKLLPEIARELGVDAVVEGSVLRSEGRVRISAQLVDATTDRHLWAESYEREMEDVLALQREVAGAIVREIQVRLTPQESKRLSSGQPVAPAAYEAYLQGRHHWNRRTPDSLFRAIERFEAAARIDPEYAPAYAGLAACYVVLPAPSIGGLSPSAAMPKAKSAALRALELDDSLAEAHATLAYELLHYEWDWTGAEVRFQRALALDANDATTHFWYAVFLAARGRTEDALSSVERARNLDPVSPIIHSAVAWIHHFARQDDQVIANANKALDLAPDFPIAHARLAIAFNHLSRHDQAIAHLEKALAATGRSPDVLATLGQILAAAGRRAEARQILEDLKGFSGRQYVSAYQVALVYLELDERERALEWLERAGQERSWGVALLNVEPDLDPLRSEARLQRLVREIGLSPR